MFDDLLPRLFAVFLQHLWRLSPSSSDHVVVGKDGRVTDPIPPGRLGAVLVPIRGGTEEFYARCVVVGDAIPAGQMVRVVAYAPPRTVEVEPLSGLTLSKTPTQEF